MNIPGTFPLRPEDEIYWRWRVLSTARGKAKWHTLRWTMSEQGVAEWRAAPDNVGNVLEMVKVPNSGENRGPPGAGDYPGPGQAEMITAPKYGGQSREPGADDE